VLTLESFQKKYDTTTSELVINGRNFRFFMARTLEHFVDQHDIFQDFPLWIKIWEASFVLAEFLARLDADAGKRFVEIGCGLGVVGIVASAFGHLVTMTEHNLDALNFARANALLNQVSNLEIRALDWYNPEIEGSSNYIVGSEILYTEGDLQPILNLFRSYLKAGGEIILAEGIRKTIMAFMHQMADYFQIEARKKVLRSKDKETAIMLCKMKPKREFG